MTKQSTSNEGMSNDALMLCVAVNRPPQNEQNKLFTPPTPSQSGSFIVPQNLILSVSVVNRGLVRFIVLTREDY